MRIPVLLLAVLALARCSNEVPATDTTDTRMSIATEYVRGAKLPIHAKPSDDSAVVTTYQNGEAVSVLSKRGDWAEVRTVTGSGWVHARDLANAAEARQAEADNTHPKFTRIPAPVSNPGAHGELVFEAIVNADGDVTAVRTISNTTGSMALEQKNTLALQQARFTPVVRHGKREGFVYEHRVHY